MKRVDRGGWAGVKARRRFSKIADKVDDAARIARKAAKRRNARIDAMEVSRSKAAQVSLPKLKCLAEQVLA